MSCETISPWMKLADLPAKRLDPRARPWLRMLGFEQVVDLLRLDHHGRQAFGVRAERQLLQLVRPYVIRWRDVERRTYQLSRLDAMRHRTRQTARRGR